MLQIKKMRCDHVIDFAAEELKKYLRMMMPEGGDIAISTEPEAKDGFRLGLLEDFGLPFEGEDARIDDVVHIDTQECGGILAGSNSRSVLFAVYRLLKLHGCRWLYPGIDGEYIPMTDLKPQSYHKMADMRFRGHCNEGAESQQCMLETIDFYPKQEINVYMLEFDNPYVYYGLYYDHKYNETNRPAEKISRQQVKQWKRQCEAEIAKRGLQFHDMGHGWTAEPFGLDSTEGWASRKVTLTKEQETYLAEIKGERKLCGGVALNTNLCMSNPKVRTIMADSIVNYATKHKNVDYLHVWLADGVRNHCECEECQKMRPTDYYIMIMNEIDEKLTALNLNTRIVFIAYYDSLFAPEKIRINNPQRFSLLYAPITRSYTASVTESTVAKEPMEYIRNAWTVPKSAEENLGYLKAWQKVWPGPCFSYEYHFWRHQYLDPAGMEIAKRIYQDIQGLKYMGLDGFVEDGSQRSFWPNGFAIYVYAEALLNRDLSFEEIAEDYFSHIYGEDWQSAYNYLEKMSKTFDFAFMEGEKSINRDISIHYNPKQKAKLDLVEEIAAEGRSIAEKHLTMPTRPQTVSWRMLLKHADYCEGIASFMIERCLGNNTVAYEKYQEFFAEFGKYEVELERYYDQYLSCYSYFRHMKLPKKVVLQAGGDE